MEMWTEDGELGRGGGGLESPNPDQVVEMGCREPKEMLVEDGWGEEYMGSGGE